MDYFELNMDGLVGPTHHYAGLSKGNLASTKNAMSTANPQAAALQGLQKMRLLHSMGIKQGLLPPQQRPNLALLHQLGFTGSPAQQISKAANLAPELLSACYSASSMWSANAATVSSSRDTNDNRVHFTAANLVSNLHRHQEADFSKQLLQQVFADDNHFQHHEILPRSLVTGDEGAANHNRLCEKHGQPGINFFVYGKQILNAEDSVSGPVKYPARQTLEACQILARNHRLDLDKVIFAQQSPEVIDQGVFHNDVIAVANESLFLVHESAFVNQNKILAELRVKADFPLQILEIRNEILSVQDAVLTYLFNSQLITLNDGSMALISPIECETHPRVKSVIEEIINDKSNPVTQVHYLDLKQSMRNGGGPACLRLRIPLSEQELQAMHQEVLVNDPMLDCLENWVKKYYRTHLQSQDLADPLLVNESLRALDELTSLLKLGSIYPFQREINH